MSQRGCAPEGGLIYQGPHSVRPRLPAGCGTERSAPPHLVDSETNMSRRRQIYEGKAKVLFEGPEPGTLVQYFKDDAAAFNNQKRGTITGKGVLNNRICEFLMVKLAVICIPTHFVRRLNMREQLVREVEIIPLRIVVRNVAAGSLAKRLVLIEGAALP